jgi:hypothetical protein
MGITGSKSTESLESNGGGGFSGQDGFDGDPYAHGAAQEEQQFSTITSRELEDLDPQQRIPMVFRWNYPAQDVWVAGTFTGTCVSGRWHTWLLRLSLVSLRVP